MRRILAGVVVAVGLLGAAVPSAGADSIPEHFSMAVDPVGPGSCWQNPGGSTYVTFRERYQTANGPASRVRLSVRRESDGAWLQPDGSFSTASSAMFFGDPALLPAPMGAGWSRVIDEPLSGFGPGWRATTWRWDPPTAIPTGPEFYVVAATVDDDDGTRAGWTQKRVQRIPASSPC